MIELHHGTLATAVAFALGTLTMCSVSLARSDDKGERAGQGALVLPERSAVGFKYEPPAQDSTDTRARSGEASSTPGSDAKLDTIQARLVPRFGEAGSRWWTVGTGVADNFIDSVDSNLHLAYTYFLANDIEFTGEVAGWHFNQPGDNTFGVSAVMVVRWHFIDSGPWTVYTDAGVGVLAATDTTPSGGSSFDLMPRAGVGFTRQLTDSGTRLQVGVRWHHISNARIFGDANNPARDGAMVYAGIIFPF